MGWDTIVVQLAAIEQAASNQASQDGDPIVQEKLAWTNAQSTSHWLTGPPLLAGASAHLPFVSLLYQVGDPSKTHPSPRLLSRYLSHHTDYYSACCVLRGSTFGSRLYLNTALLALQAGRVFQGADALVPCG